MQPVIEVRDLERTFGSNRAVDGLTFSVEHGEVFGLLGPNGAGKTTTIRLLNGILPPSAGSARILGMDPTSQGDAVRSRTGVLTENPSLYERLSARENLVFFGTLAEVPIQTLEKRVLDLLSFFELESRANDKVETYSKGMKQRLALARALIHKPPLLFLDEPTSGLDPEAAQHVEQLIGALSQEEGRTVVLCTHNLMEAQNLCNRVGIMSKGKFLAVGSLKELAQELWPAKWVDFCFAKDPAPDLRKGLKSNPEVLQVEADGCRISVQLKSEAGIPMMIRHMAERSELLSVQPRQYRLEDIYFALQESEA